MAKTTIAKPIPEEQLAKEETQKALAKAPILYVNWVDFTEVAAILMRDTLELCKQNQEIAFAFGETFSSISPQEVGDEIATAFDPGLVNALMEAGPIGKGIMLGLTLRAQAASNDETEEEEGD